MPEKNRNYKALFSSDWNECLAPCGPFDFLSFCYPDLTSSLEHIFQQYTTHIISLSEATRRIETALSAPISEEQMDGYLDKSFTTYQGVPDLIEWCLSKNILFMINTTGVLGYFQRILAKHLLPPVPVVSANPLLRYAKRETDPSYLYELLEIEDKGKNTEAVARSWGIPHERTLLMGDSGGDGPHFEWGQRHGACLVASMLKPSLALDCQRKGIQIHKKFGLSYEPGEKRNLKQEMVINFLDLSSFIEECLLFH